MKFSRENCLCIKSDIVIDWLFCSLRSNENDVENDMKREISSKLVWFPRDF